MVMRSTNDMYKAFQQHFQDQFIKEHGLCEQEFRSYVADLPRVSSTIAADCEA